MLRPGPAVPIERPPTVEEVIDELRARLRSDPSTQPTAHSATVQPLAHRSRPLPQWTSGGTLSDAGRAQPSAVIPAWRATAGDA